MFLHLSSIWSKQNWNIEREKYLCISQCVEISYFTSYSCDPNRINTEDPIASSTDSTQTASYFDDFLHTAGLNHCLVKICEFLDVPDLINFHESFDEDKDTFMTLLNEVIYKKRFDFAQIQSEQSLWSVNKVFESFGQSMRRVKVSKFYSLFLTYLNCRFARLI